MERAPRSQLIYGSLLDFLGLDLTFGAAKLLYQSHSAVMGNGQARKAVLSHGDIQRREALFGFDVQLRAVIHQELNDGVGASQQPLRGARFRPWSWLD